MSKTIKILCLLAIGSSFLVSCTVQQITQSVDDYLKKINTNDVIAGLKEALIQGTSFAVSQTKKTNGYLNNSNIKIPFPPDVAKVADQLRTIGMGKQVDRFIQTLNQGAEMAANEAKPIFTSAIKSMTIQDAWNILKGEDKEAATHYLIKTTSPELKKKYEPIIRKALDKTHATKYYKELITAYNSIPFTTKMNPNLETYATEKALDGLFFMVSKEEKKIRENPAARATELLKRVFKVQD